MKIINENIIVELKDLENTTTSHFLTEINKLITELDNLNISHEDIKIILPKISTIYGIPVEYR